MADMAISDVARSETRSILQIAQHFVMLKDRASEFLRDFAASERGFFTPSEDDQLRQLLVSYWHSRNALLELVTGYHRDAAEVEETDRPVRFLAAFAGALVLIDGARFIRDRVHDRPVVRAKLNEPEPHFGVEAGAYDQIQKSLTSPVHAWHLYHALHYFERSQPQLSELAAQDDQLQQVFELIVRLRDRLDVSATQLATARARVRARALRTRVERDVIGRAMYGLQKAISRLVSDVSVKRHHVPRLPNHVALEVAELLQPGDVLVTRKEHAATNYFLPGFWPHAALFVGDAGGMMQHGLNGLTNIAPHWDEVVNIDANQPGRVVESMKDGVRLRSLATPLQCDAITVLRPRLEAPLLHEVVHRAFFHVGKPYDFDFDFSRSDRMVCTEVVYRAYDGVGGVGFELTKRAGRLTLAAEDLMRMALTEDSFEVLACFVPGHTTDLKHAEAAVDLVQNTIGCGR